jgi:septum formation protein
MADAAPDELVTELARAKAAEVAAKVATEYAEAVVIGCDSLLEIRHDETVEMAGKPHHPDVAKALWQRNSGRSARLLTGHCAIAVHGGEPGATAVGSEATTIHFGTPSQEELDAYVASGEPLEVAGGFTVDGLGGWFIEAVDGVPSSVIGISLPLTRRLLVELGISVTTLWR